MKSVGAIDVPYPTSWVDEERDLSPWLGNVMQQEAINKLYSVAERVRISGDKKLQQDWDYLQASNNFRFISTKPNSYGGYRGIYDSPYDAFTNYMNIVGDFVTRVNNIYGGMDNEELNSLLTTIKNQDEELASKEKEIKQLKQAIAKLTPAADAPVAEEEKKPAAKKAPAKKCAPKKEVVAEAPAKPAKKAPAKKATAKK
jgi:alpha-amylase